MSPKLIKAVKAIAKHTLGNLPPSGARLTGPLARDGGKRVRDTRIRPWANASDATLRQWLFSAGPALRRVFLSGVEGSPQPYAKQFAQRWAAYCGCKYGLLLPHGTDALRIGLAAALDHDGLDYGGEVIVPNLSFIASANAALDRRFGLVFVDVDPQTLLLDPARVEEAIIPGRTRAIIPVHLFGQPANMTALKAIAKRYKLKIVEDAAQAHGAAWANEPTGSLGDVAGFSFQSFKNLNCGEGGALTTNDEEIFERAYSMHNVGRSFAKAQRWEHVTLGWNCRISEYQAAILIHRFGRFEREQEIRRRNFERLTEMLADAASVEVLGVAPEVSKHGVHMFVMRYRREHCGGLPIEDFLTACGAEGAPIHRGYECTMASQPAMERLIDKRPDYSRVMPTPVADRAVDELIYIPQNVFLGTEADMRDISFIITKVERHFRNTPARSRRTERAMAASTEETVSHT